MEFFTDLIHGINSPRSGEFIFKSSDHIRFQNGYDVSGHNYGCNRSIKIEPNINNGPGYTVSIYNDDNLHPLWGTNLQMAPKQMQVIDASDDIVRLQGYGRDSMGASFSNYAITLNLAGNEVISCVLHMLDRGVDLLYLK